MVRRCLHLHLSLCRRRPASSCPCATWPRPAAARSYLDDLARTLGRTDQAINLGAGQAFLTPTGNAVVQKDEHVLVVDVSGLPATWLNPPQDRAQVATAVASAIMGCWMGG